MSSHPKRRSPLVPRVVALLVVMLFVVAPLSVQAEEALPATETDLAEEAATAPDDVDIRRAAPDGAFATSWLQQAPVRSHTLAVGDGTPFEVHSKAPPLFFEGPAGPTLELPCSSEMRAVFDAALCMVPADVLEHAQTFFDDTHIPVIIDVAPGRTLSEAADVLAASGLARDVWALGSIGMLVADFHMGHLDAFVHGALEPVAEKVWLDRPVRAHLDKSVPLVRADGVWSMQDTSGHDIKGRNITIAILDTGIDMGHPDVGGCSSTDFDAGTCKVAKWRVFTAESCARPCDGHGHGTHVAATAAGQGTFDGVAPEATLWGGKVLANSGSGYWSGVISGIEWAASEGADVISMSLGGGCSPCDGSDPVSQAVDQATADGTLVVVAAGNSGLGGLGTPAVARTAVTVAATDDNDALASFSSRGPTEDLRSKPDLAAPGVAICAARAGTAFSANCGTQHTSISGTSMATPHVSGAAALLKQQHPEWGPAELTSALVAAAVDTGHLPFEAGAGRLDVWRSAHAPFTADAPAIDFGNLGATANATRNITFTNHGTTTLNLSFTPQDAEDLDTGTAHAIATASPAKISLAPGAAGTVDVRVDLTALGGAFQGILAVEGSGDTYRVPYTVARLARIDVSVTAQNSTLYGVHTLANETFASVDYSSGAQATFWVPPGTYSAFSYNAPSSDPSFVIRQEVQVDIGDEVTVTTDLADTDLHTFEARDPDGDVVQVESGNNALRIYDADGGLAYRVSYMALGFANDQSRVHLKGLDLSGSGHALHFAKGLAGAYAPECEKSFWQRSWLDHSRCRSAFDTADAFLFAGLTVQDPDGAVTSHTWNATDHVGPFSRSYDVRHSGAAPLEGAGVIAPDSWIAIMALREGHAGRDQDVYFHDDPAWGIHASAFVRGETYERVADFAFDADLRGDDLRTYDTPPSFARLLTDGTTLASERHVFTDGLASWYARSGLLNVYSYDSWQTPHVAVYKDDVLQKSSYLAWDQNVDVLGQKLVAGAAYRAVLTLPDVGWGTSTQTHEFTGGQSTPTATVDYAPRFIQGYPYEVTVLAGDTATDVAVEVRQGGAWLPLSTTQEGAQHTASYVPLSGADIQLRVTATKGGNSVSHQYDTAAREGVPLEVDVSHSNGKASVTCSKIGGGACPDISVRLLCDGVDVRGAGVTGGATSGIVLDCAGEATAVFAGSGPYYQGASPPEVTIDRPRPYHVYVDDVERSRQTRIQVPITTPQEGTLPLSPSPIAPSPFLPTMPVDPWIDTRVLDDDAWVLGDLTVRFRVQGDADLIDLYVGDRHKASFTPDPSGSYSWLWTLEDQMEHHGAGYTQIRVEASHKGSVDIDREDILLLSPAGVDTGTPHFDGAGAWAGMMMMTTGTPNPITVDPVGLVEDILDSIVIGPIHVQSPVGAWGLSTRAGDGTMPYMDPNGRLVTEDVQGVAWSYEPVLDWSDDAYRTWVQWEDGDMLRSMTGYWLPEPIVSTCTASFPSTCWHYAVGPMALYGSGPMWRTFGELNGVHGAFICTAGSQFNIHHPCGGDETPPEEFLRRVGGITIST